MTNKLFLPETNLLWLSCNSSFGRLTLSGDPNRESSTNLFGSCPFSPTPDPSQKYNGLFHVADVAEIYLSSGNIQSLCPMRMERQVTKAPCLLLGSGRMDTADKAPIEPCIIRGWQQESSLTCHSHLLSHWVTGSYFKTSLNNNNNTSYIYKGFHLFSFSYGWLETNQIISVSLSCFLHN